MRHSRIIFLLLSSLVLYSCADHKLASFEKKVDVTEKRVKSFIPADKAIKYKASIDVLNKHFTGLIVIKQTDTVTKHLVFLTELGMRMFDFEWKKDSMKPVFVFDALNKPKLITALIKNFETIFLVKWGDKYAKSIYRGNQNIVHLKEGKKDSYFISENEPNSTSVQWVFYKHRKEARVIYINDYNKIKLKQYGLVKFYIELDKINE